MNGIDVQDYAMTATPAEARLIRELHRYCVMPSHNHDGTIGAFCVYIWQAARKNFRYIGRASNYSGADDLMRAHIRQRQRRRARYSWRWSNLAPRRPLRRCPNCKHRTRYADTYGDCYYCQLEYYEQLPDDYPALDAGLIFGL